MSIQVPTECRTCAKNCMIQFGVGMTTDMYFPPVYDKHGNNTNPDGNITSGKCMCTACNKQWLYSKQYGKTEFEEIK